MSETFPLDHPVRLEAVGWKDREDFEHLLDVWEVGRCGPASRGLIPNTEEVLAAYAFLAKRDRQRTQEWPQLRKREISTGG